jgi:hypothetical protein
MKRVLRFSAKFAAILAMLVCLPAANAHMLPISYLTVVPDTTHVHVEFVVNPYDCNFSPRSTRIITTSWIRKNWAPSSTWQGLIW